MPGAIERPRRRSETYAAQGSENRNAADARFQEMKTTEREGFEPPIPLRV